MAGIFRYDGENGRRLVAAADDRYTIRGHFAADHDAEAAITVTQQYGPSADGHSEVLALTAHSWPGALIVAHVVREWKRGGDYGKCWNEVRRQALASTGTDIGDPPTRWGDGSAEAGAAA